MTAARFWVGLGLKVVGFCVVALLIVVFLAILANPRICETVQTHENRSVTLCRSQF